MTTNNSVNVALSGSTGSGSFVGSTSATLTTPDIGVATGTSLNLSSGAIGLNGNNLYIKQVTLNQAAMTSLYSAPSLLIANPGSNKMIMPVQFIMNYVFNTTAFTIGTAGFLIVQYDSTVHAGGTSVGGGGNLPTGFVDQNANKIKFVPASLASSTSSTCIDKGLYFSQQTADMTDGGTSSLIITILYYIVSAS